MTETDPEYALVVCGDSSPAFAQGLAVTVRSTLAHLDADCRPVIYVLDCGLPGGAVSRLAHVVERTRPDIDVRIVDVDLERLEALPNQSYFPAASFARLFIDEFVGDTVVRLVYLDADLLVRRDISPLFSLNLDGSPLGAVRDVHKASPDGDPSRSYFNSGVLAIDIPAWRAARVKDRAVSYVQSHAELAMIDQDALNAVVPDWHQLEYGWNLQLGALLGGVMPEMPAGWMSRDELNKLRRTLRSSSAILHFTVRKPWSASHGALPGSWRWAICFVRTGWLPPLQSGIWLCRWLLAGMRYSIGTRRQTLGRRLHEQTAAWRVGRDR